MTAEPADLSSESPQKTCAHCKKKFPTASVHPLAPGFKYLAVFALSAAHSGAFLLDAWSHHYCDACRRRFSILSLLIAAVFLIITFFAFRWAYEKGFIQAARAYWMS